MEMFKKGEHCVGGGHDITISHNTNSDNTVFNDENSTLKKINGICETGIMCGNNRKNSNKKGKVKKGLALTNYDLVNNEYVPSSSSSSSSHCSEKEKAKKERVVVSGWIFTNSQLTHEYQLYLIENLYNTEYGGEYSDGVVVKNKELVFITSQINNKKNGYKQQDIEKQLYDQRQFANFRYIVELLYISKLQCYYCNEHVHILYKYVRDPKQWTLERIFNDRGHNVGNVKIACLTCNLRRKTMHYQKYVDTKRMSSIIKIDGNYIAGTGTGDGENEL